MKPEQLNRLMRAKGQVQPWFLRNTTELYECAIRTYYERSSAAIPYSAHNRNARLRLENAGPVRKLKRAHPEPTAPDNYPHNHRLQTDLATNANSNKLLNTVLQATRRRSMSYSVGTSRPGAGGGSGVSGGAAATAAQPYSVYGKSVLSGSSSSCSTATSSSGTSHDGFPGHFGRRTFLKTPSSSKKSKKSKKQQPTTSEKPTQGLFSSGRSFSLPPRPTIRGMDTSVARPMPPNTKHHLEAMQKNAQVNFASLPRSEGDNLMVVDAALKRRISVVPYDDETPQPRGYSNRLRNDGGNTWKTARRHRGNESGNSDGNSEIVSQSSEVRYRFQTLADRIKQFEYIQFADGPVTSFAFDRRQKMPATRKKAKKASRIPDTESEVPNTTSSSSSVAPMRRKKMDEQPRQLGYNNVLHSNHRQRSRSLEMEPPLMESIGLLNTLEKSPKPTTASPRGSSVDSPGRSFFRPAITSTWAAAYAARNAENGGSTKDSDVKPETAVRIPSTFTAKNYKKKYISRKSLGVSRPGSSGKIRPQTPTYTVPLPPGHASSHPPGTVSKALEPEASTSEEIDWRKKPKTSSGANTKNNNWTIGYKADYGNKSTGAAGPSTTWAGITKNVNLSPGFRAEEYATGTTLKNSYRSSTAGSASASKRAATAPTTARGKATTANPSIKPPAFTPPLDLKNTNPSPVRRFQMQQQGSLEEARKDTDIMTKTKPTRSAHLPEKSVGQSMEQEMASMVRANVYSRTSHRAHAQLLPQDTPNPNPTAKISKKPPGHSSQVVRKREDEKDITADRKAEKRDQEVQIQNEVRESSEVASTPSYVSGTPLGKQPVYPKGANQLLVASATQVSAYKRAFRSQQQMLKAEMLNQQAKLLQQEDNPQANYPPSTSHPKAMPTPSPVVATGKFRSGEAANGGLPLTAPPLQSHRAPPLPTGRAGVRPIARRNGVGESSRGMAIRHSRRDMGGAATTYLRSRESGSTGLRIKADATSITEPAQAIRRRFPTLTPPTYRSLPDSTTTTTMGRTAVPQLKITTKTKTRGSKQSINAAKERDHQQERTKQQDNRNWDRYREGARARIAGDMAIASAAAATTYSSTRPRRTKMALTAQQPQHYHLRHDNGTSSALLGFRRETPSRAASRLLQRREDSGLQSRSQSQSSSHLQQQQSQSQRRQFHYTVNPPWRPLY
ncbi:uncharacterized protein [Drosophila bipectinata]|uniref:uncharacterized protein n=1 Tax=Drosophila bipectinata TaxID=42026 RepID=UPI001C899404|nr:uncharacterized protein LOC108128498 [Drosophila bipectinata]